MIFWLIFIGVLAGLASLGGISWIYIERKTKGRWVVLAKRLGIDVAKGRRFNERTSLHGIYRNHPIRIYIDTVRSGKYSTDYTVVDVDFDSKCKIDMAMYKKAFSAKLAEKLGAQDVKLGNSQFDKKYMLKGKNEEAIREILNQEIQEKIIGIGDCNLKMAGGNASFRQKGNIKDIDKLNSVIDVTIEIVENAERIEELGEPKEGIPYGIPISDEELETSKKKSVDLKDTGPFK